MHVTHVITGLGPGGAESMLHKLVGATRGRGISHSVVSLTGSGPIGDLLVAEGIPVTTLGMRRGVPELGGLARLVRLLRRERPAVVQSWMYHANLVAGIAAAAAGRIPLVWGIHHADVHPDHVRPLTRWTRGACARLSGVLPSRIVCCGDAALRSHAGIGYRALRMVAIPNGFETERFQRDRQAGDRIRTSLAIPPGAPLVGLVARFHPDKDHRNFLAAAARVAEVLPAVTFLLAGQGITWSNATLAGWIRAVGLQAHVRLLGVRHDMPAVFSALDVLALSSRAEGFPNVLGEAMCCEVPCAVTDCGDAADIVGPTGRVAPRGDASALAHAMLDLLAVSPAVRAALGRQARERVIARYDLQGVARRYAELYCELGGRRPAERP